MTGEWRLKSLVQDEFPAPDVGDGVLIRGVRLPARDSTVDVRLTGGKVQAIEPKLQPLEGEEVVEARGRWLLPGWIDVQVNDAGWLAQGLKSVEEHAVRMRAVLARQAARGATGVVIATLAAPVEEIVAYLRGIERVIGTKAAPSDSILLGALVEGTFMNPDYCGAHNPRWVLPPSGELLETFLSTGAVAMLNVAPETDERALEVIETATARGVVVGVGHAKPHGKHLRDAVAAGARYIIHLGNGPTGSNLKVFNDGGMMEESLRNDDLIITVIVDGFHVHPQLVRDWLERKELERFIAISDVGFAMGAPTGEFEVFGIPGRVARDGSYLEVVRKTSAAPENLFSSDRSNLFGAAIDIQQVFQNMLNLLTRDMPGVYYRRHRAYELTEAVHAASETCAGNPARLLRLADRGVLAPGARADALLVEIGGDPGEYDVRLDRVWLGG